MSTPGETEQPRATPASDERLEWQSELDASMAAIDSSLTHPQRRASDHPAQPRLPQLGHLNLTPEMLDELAWRVAEQIRNSSPPAEPEPEPEPERLARGIALTIRIRKPLFRFWRRRRRESLISFVDSRIT